MQKGISIFLAIIKWPVALLSLFLLIPAFYAFISIFAQMLSMHIVLWVLLPCALVAGVWFFMPHLAHSFFSVLEHETTHLIFIILSFNKPKKMQIHDAGGGSMSFAGRPNWLIAISPYFFPTFPFVVMFASLFFEFFHYIPSDIYWASFGALLGYHIAGTLLQIHPKQTDFQKAGYLFTLVFLPGINLIMYGILFSYACANWSGVFVYFNTLLLETTHFVDKLLQSA